MDINLFRKSLASKQKLLDEARTQDPTDKEDARNDKEIAGYAANVKRKIPNVLAVFKDFVDEWERMVRVDGSARTQDLGAKNYPFKKEDVEDAHAQFDQWLSKFWGDLDALIKDIKSK